MNIKNIDLMPIFGQFEMRHNYKSFESILILLD
jgi:hypothetical protein